MFIYSKNHKVYRAFDDLTKLMNYLRTHKTIYVKAMNRVMPCKFFFNYAWLKSKKFADYFYNGEFCPCEKKEDISRKRIRNALSVCVVGNNNYSAPLSKLIPHKVTA